MGGVGGEQRRCSLMDATRERILRSLQAGFHQWWVISSILQPDALAMLRRGWLEVKWKG